MKTAISRTVFLIIVLFTARGFSDEQPCVSCGGWENKSAVGLRLALAHSSFVGERYFTTEINYQIPLFKSNRLNVGATFGAYTESFGPAVPSEDEHAIGTEYGATASYLWVYNVCGGFSWFIGPGVWIGKWRRPIWESFTISYHDYTGTAWRRNGWTEARYVGVGPHVGIEYKFKSPLAISLDFRPIFGFWGGGGDLTGFGFGYGVKYAF